MKISVEKSRYIDYDYKDIVYSHTSRRIIMYKINVKEKLADKIFLMVVEAPRVARSCEPGQFVIVKMDEKGERIPLTICD